MGAIAFIAFLVAVAFLKFKNPDMLRYFLPGQATTEQANVVDTEESNTSGLTAAAAAAAAADSESTPTAKATNTSLDPPSFTLDDKDDCTEEVSEERFVTPSFPAPNSAQRAGAMPPPLRPNSSPRTNQAVYLPVPTNGPLPNRGPPVGSQQRVSDGLLPRSAVKTSNTRGKVLLSPGHSPMDWAALTKKGSLAGTNGFQRVTPNQLRQMTGRRGKPAWSSWQGKVYNITPYLPFHPGGEAELMKAAGRDGMKLFLDVHPWVNWENMLGTCLVGVMVPEEYAQDASPLEEMD